MIKNKKPLFPETEEMSAIIYRADILTDAKPRSIWRGKYEAGISEAEGNKRLIPEDAFIYAFPEGFFLAFNHGDVYALTRCLCWYLHNVHACKE